MNENIIAKILFIIGVAQMAAGVIIGLITVTANYYMASWSIFFAWTLGGFMTGMLFIGFAENIRLLHSINEKVRSSKQKQEMQVQKEYPNADQQPVDWVLSEADKAKIYENYEDETIVEIVPSPKEDYCLVRFKSGHEYYVRVIYVGGFGVQETDDTMIRQSIIQWYNDRD